MGTEVCRSCRSEIDEDDFCGHCGEQARCSTCHASLKANKRFCGKCGTEVGLTGADGAAPDAAFAPTPAGMNTIEYREDRASRSLRATFTDETASNLVTPLTAALGGRITVPTPRSRVVPSSSSAIIDAEALSLPAPSDDTGDKSDILPPVANTQAATESEVDQLHHVFRYDSDHLQLIESRLKAANQMDYARRLTYLFLYAHSLDSRERIPRADLNAALKDAGVYDSNTLNWVRKSPELLVEGAMVGLRVSGREKAKDTLAQISNPHAHDDWLPGTASKATSKARSVKAGATSQDTPTPKRRASGRAKSKDVGGWVKAWKARVITIDHAMLEGWSPTDKGIFGLWAIRTVDEDSGKIVSRGKLARFLYEAFEVRANERSLERGLGQPAAKGKVIHVEGTRYQITPTGMGYARQMAGLPQEPLRAVTTAAASNSSEA